MKGGRGFEGQFVGQARARSSEILKFLLGIARSLGSHITAGLKNYMNI